MEFVCERCRKARMILFALILGGVAGAASLHYGADKNMSMLATFTGAFLPILFYARKNRKRK